MSRRRRSSRPSSGPPFVQLFHHVLKSEEFRQLSTGARSLLLEFARRFNGHNNGNLEMTARQFKEAGLGSEPTMRKYITELVNAGWIVVTRYGGMRSGPNLYALTYLGIDQTNVEYDDPYKADTLPLDLWKDRNAGQRTLMKVPNVRSGLHRLRSGGDVPVQKPVNDVAYSAGQQAA